MKKIAKNSALILFSFLVLSVSSIFLFSEKTEAFGGKCWSITLGDFDKECLERNKSREVTMIYAKDLRKVNMFYVGASRAGGNWTNHINREYTKTYRNDDTRESRSSILQRSAPRLRSLRSTALASSDLSDRYTDAALYRKALQRREKYKAFSKLYE